ncbi:uncharacterized protein LY89DRAFT_659779 [Mollisia scopiformis]|uniref:Uncharacterized protein n=1 Tax=Mollisia scopiformis TaxID=149040 RepID=A0A132B741_MOLSC|nr:uncharacterized protein LY89DRAFT_659779 [Mollisia scopiformis]KUJ08063.1 hypothetical protein LY89DRAFT_659779 [Mollisia scopiformis]
MGSSKLSQPPAAYRDDPDYAETASMSSAVLLDDVESAFPEEELPAYTDEPSAPLVDPSCSSESAAPPPASEQAILHGYYCPPCELPFSTHDLSYTEYRTRFPNYSTDSNQLYKMIRHQAAHCPSYFVTIYGTHTETRRNGNKETKDKITDFHLRINISYLLGQIGSGKMELLADNKRGYRGTRLASLKPSVSADEENAPDELRRWCDRYVADPSGVKSFLLKRKILNHDTKKLEQLIRSAISETNYRGHVSIDFPIQHQKVLVYSPGRLNEWRITVWIRWFFYLTFLWIFAWPVLFFMTARYEVVKVNYLYATEESGHPARTCSVMSEVEWYYRWQSAIKRAALARMVCKDTCLDEEYRAQTQLADERGERVGREPDIPRTGNTWADGALGLLGQGLRVAENYSNARGWGADT